MMTLSEWQKEVHRLARQKGFYDHVHEYDDAAVAQKLLLVVEELSEAHAEIRSGHAPTDVYYREDGKPEGFPVELADAVIRILDLAEWLGINLEAQIVKKHMFNTGRPYKHGRAF